MEGDLAPHGAIITIQWGTHAVRADGQYDPNVKDSGRMTFDVKGQDRAITNEYVKAIIDQIKGKATNVNETEVNAERPGQSRIQGAQEPRRNNANVLGMRGAIGKDHVG